ncbi:MAG: hypothetical protein JW739_05605 [Opitutales bacterium]|nr:hypothetical protein [Opitutales bacterium]
MELTTSQIAEYNALTAFAITRENLAGLSAPTTENENPTKVSTSSIEDSVSLLSGSLERLNSVNSNLYSMLKLSEEAASSDVTDERKQEIYALMRSLSAGINELITDTTFDGKNTINGNTLYLSNGTTGGSSYKLSVEDMSVWEDGLNLATQKDGAIIDLWESKGTAYLNNSSDLEGLEFASAEYIEPAAGYTELKNGDYKVEISYYGSESSVILRDDNGIEIDRVDGVNLSGSGTTTVEMNAGIKFTIDKEQSSKYFDKYNYITNGATSYYSDLTYQRVYTHNLSSGGNDGSDSDSSVKLLFGSLPSTEGETGNLSLTEITTSSVDPEDELASGTYSLQIDYKGDYNGDKSSVMLMNGKGVIVSAKTIDLSELGSADIHTIDFGNGVSISIDSNDFDSDTGTLKTSFVYTQSTSAYDTFDYEAYIEQIESAILVVDEQITEFKEAQESLTNIYQIQSTIANGGDLSSVMYGTGATTANSLLSSSIGTSNSLLGVLSNTQVNQYLSFTSEAINGSAAAVLSSTGSNSAGLLNALMIQ